MFKLAKPIYLKNHLKELNSNVFFTLKFKKREGICGFFSSNNEFRMFLNGKFIAYGPARAAHNYYRIEKIEFNNLKEENYLVIEVNGSNANTYYTLNLEPFFTGELVDKNNEVIAYTGKDFKGYNNIFRYRKVLRYSFQRGFSEAYHYDENYNNFLKGKFNLLNEDELIILDKKEFLEKHVKDVNFVNSRFKLVESGYFLFNESKPLYDDRYMHLTGLKIFDLNELDVNPNKFICKLDYFKDKKLDREIKTKKYYTYSFKESLTGFINLKIKVNKPAKVYIIFEEINLNLNDFDNIEINPFRNTTNNVIYLNLEKGNYDFISFEPYSAKYIRVIIEEGEVTFLNVSMIEYANSDIKNFKYSFFNKKIQKIVDSALNTFRQNSVDLFSDCPSRERAGWLCDSYFTGKAETLISGTNLVEDNFLENYALFNSVNIPQGLVPMCYPADFFDGNYIPNWCLWYILEVCDYLKRSNNQKIVNQSKENIKNIINYFKKYENEIGLLENLEGWIFVEWSKANDDEFIKGINFPSNMIYSEALCKAGILLNDPNLIQKGNKLKRIIRKYSFNGDFFVDNAIRNEKNQILLTSNITETCQYYAFFFNVVNRKNYSNLFKILKNKFGPFRDDKVLYPNVYKSNAFPGDILRLFILNKYGYKNEVKKEVVQYFYNMTKLTGTLWEHDSYHASLNHGFTSVVINIIISAYFGLEEINNQTKTLYFNKKHLSDFAKVELPLINGKLILENNKDGLIIDNQSDYQIIYNE